MFLNTHNIRPPWHLKRQFSRIVVYMRALALAKPKLKIKGAPMSATKRQINPTWEE